MHYNLVLVSETFVQSLGKAGQAKEGIAQQHACIAVPAESLKVNKRKAAGELASRIGDARNGLMLQVVDMQFVIADQAGNGADAYPCLRSASTLIGNTFSPSRGSCRSSAITSMRSTRLRGLPFLDSGMNAVCWSKSMSRQVSDMVSLRLAAVINWNRMNASI